MLTLGHMCTFIYVTVKIASSQRTASSHRRVCACIKIEIQEKELKNNKTNLLHVANSFD